MDGLKRKHKRNALVECSCSSPPPPPPTNSKIKPIGRGVEEVVVVVGMITINDLTEALLIEILIRIPAKSAHLCKSVCKLWNLLISNPHFASQFIRHNKPSSLSSSLPLLIFQRYYNNTRSVKQISDQEIFKCDVPSFLSFLPFSKPNVVGSSGGLLLCCPDSDDENQSSVYYVCNPVTKKWVQLPPPPNLQKQVHIGFICGIEEELNYRFSVVRIPLAKGILKSFRLEIFSSETGEWSEAEVVCPPKGFFLDCSCLSFVVCNGILHLLNTIGDLCYDFPHNYIFAFNPYTNGTNDRFRFIDLPADVENGRHWFLGAVRGHLRLSQGISTLMVWELKDYNTSNWCLEHKVNATKMLSDSHVILDRLHGIKCRPRVIAFDPTDGDVVYLWYYKWNRCSLIVVFNLRDKTMKLISEAHNPSYSRDTVLPLELPCWPTPIPTLPRNALPY